MRIIQTIIFILMTALITGCQTEENKKAFADSSGEVKLITLAPAHFHAALVQKSMYPGIDSVVHVYAPEGLGLTEQMNYIKQYNSRAENPTHWVEKVYIGNDYLQKMLDDKKGNVVVLAGNNLLKTEYIKKSIDDGLNVFADKPMAISMTEFDTLKQAFADAKEKGVLLYDIMTERSVAATILQKKLANTPSVFGELETGTTNSPAIIMESVHRYFKLVSGKPLIRPDWFFDPLQEGDAIVDVGTHLVDLVQWVCFTGVSLDYTKDINIQSSKIWPTPLTLSEFAKITNESRFPDFLKKYIKPVYRTGKDDSILLTHGNGSIDYTVKGIHTRITTKWTYDAPEGAGDTYNSLIEGSKANLEIRQGAEENWKATLYVWPKNPKDTNELSQALNEAIKKIDEDMPGVGIVTYKTGWEIMIPEKYHKGHESHFADVMKRYLQYLKDGKLPAWEVPDMIAKYYITTKALEMAQK